MSVCGEEDDGNGGGLADGAQEVQAASVGEVDVEDKEVESAAGESVLRVSAGAAEGQDEVGGFEGEAEAVAEGAVVFYD